MGEISSAELQRSGSGNSTFSLPITFLAVLLLIGTILSRGCKKSSFTLTFCYIGNIEGYYAPCDCPGNPLGGIAKIPVVIEDTREYKKNVVFLVAGNSFFPTLFTTKQFEDYSKVKAELIFRSLSLLNPVAVGVGKKDLVGGIDFIKSLEERFPLRLISANLRTEKDGYLFSPFVVKELEGFKLGISGLTGKFEQEEHLYREDPVEASRKVVKQLKDMGCDFIVLLSDLDEDEEQDVIENVRGIDFVISSGNEYASEEPVRLNETIIVRPYSKLRYVGQIEFQLKGRKREFRLLNIPVVREITPKKEIENLVAQTKSLLKSMEKDVGKLFAKVPEGFVGKEKCAQCHKKEFEFWKKTPHAKAYLTLIREKEELNLDCIPCHATGSIDKGFLEGVQCEACHGEGEGHSIGRERMEKRVKYPRCIRCHDPERFPGFDYDSKIGAVMCP